MLISKRRAQRLSQEIRRVDGAQPDSGIGKHRKMALSPFVFYRGTAQLFYLDLTHQLQLPATLLSLPMTAIMGDCHTSNFGFFTEEGSHGDKVIFAANDFDDACIGHAAWDWLRFGVSLYLCAQHCRMMADGQLPLPDALRGKPVVTEAHANAAFESFFAGYLHECEVSCTLSNSHTRVLTFEQSESAMAKPYKKALKRAAGGEAFATKSALAKAVETHGQQPRFRQRDDKFRALDADTYAQLQHVFAPYMDDDIIDIVGRLNAGTGSVNMQRFYFLVGPKAMHQPQDLRLYHIVEVKQQRQAAALHYFPDLSPVNRLNPAHLTVACQRRMQRRADLVLDEVKWQGEHWLVRSRHHAKVGFDPEDIGIGKRNVDKHGFADYAYACGRALALAHSRGDRRSSRFEQAVLAHLPTQLKVLQELSKQYAGQVIADWHWFKAAVQ